MMPENLVIIRHGESLGNLAKRMSENGDHSLIDRLRRSHTTQWPLTKKGVEQAIKAGNFINHQLIRVEKMRFDRMYVSSYARAMQTAARLDLVGADWMVDTRITERDWGVLDRTTEEERLQKFREALEMREVEPFFFTPPNGESMNDVLLRVRDFVDSLYRSRARDVIAVCHGEVAKVIRMIFFGYTPMEYAEMEFSKDPAKRIHNCQIDHYTRYNPDTHECSDRIEWFRYYRPSEGGKIEDLVSPLIHLPRKRFTNSELLSEAGKLSCSFKDIEL